MVRQYLNGLWKVKIDPEENGIVNGWMNQPLETEMTVQVPGCIQQLDQLAETYPPHDDLRNGYLGTFFLEREFQLPDRKEGERCQLVVGGAAPTSYIWVNGNYVSKSSMSLTQITLDITEYVVTGKNRITVAISEQYASLVRGMRFEEFNWSGIYGQVYVELTGAIQFSEAYISIEKGKSVLYSTIENQASQEFAGEIQIRIQEHVFTTKAVLAGKSKTELAAAVNVEDQPRWSYGEPNLIEVELKCTDNNGHLCQNIFKTGLREITTEKNRVLMDGLPVFFAGAGEEYYSPTIAPLTDLKLIRDRYGAMQKYGFNFFRYHTHIPTEEELTIADEMGMMIGLEFGIVSNFNKMEPTELALEMLGRYVRQTRRHPSLVIYGLGNEGAQLMIHSDAECEKARIGYQLIKRNTTNQFAIIAFGIQGEKPELKNDIETPHLWGEKFVWAYDGLTDIPWKALEDTVGTKPNIVHEYGKFCVWPSLEDEKNGTLEQGAKPSYGRESRAWLKENGLETYETHLIEHSRHLANGFNRIVMEEARRQNYISGYVMWTFFRNSWRSRGFCDEVGFRTNGEEEIFLQGPNAEVALLMDRGFQNRTIPCEITQTIRISLSNFGRIKTGGILTIRLLCGIEVICEHISQEVSAMPGETKYAAEITFSVPVQYSGKELELRAVLEEKNGEIKAKNSWGLWAFDTAPDQETPVYFYVEDRAMHRDLKNIFPRGYKLSSVDSVVSGCRSWLDPQLVQTARRQDVLIIADTCDSVVWECIEMGCRVLLLDNGRLPENWIYPVFHEDLEGRDPSQFFTSFRAGWDQGNLVTIVEKDKVLDMFPNAGYCGLQFFDMFQYARPLNMKAVSGGMNAEASRVISSLARSKQDSKQEDMVQDVNAVKSQAAQNEHAFCAREQGYLTRVGKNLMICTLHVTDNTAGIFLLKNLVKNF